MSHEVILNPARGNLGRRGSTKCIGPTEHRDATRKASGPPEGELSTTFSTTSWGWRCKGKWLGFICCSRKGSRNEELQEPALMVSALTSVIPTR